VIVKVAAKKLNKTVHNTHAAMAKKKTLTQQQTQDIHVCVTLDDFYHSNA